MRFEYDQNKSDVNLLKHGIDFEDAQEIWDGWHAIIATVSVTDEMRELTVGRIDGAYWTAVVTHRGDAIRIISVRRSTPKERSAYDRAYNS